ncbi:MAG: recombinase family protein [Anaerolineales bacterium]|nr:recombinase family protein [Anaerolineales bacterium]
MKRQDMMPASKIQGHHRDRQAVVYVRQSTLQQVSRHQESTRLQYGLVDRALGLGWPRHLVSVIDDDLGKSGASAEGRPGFQRLVAEVSLEQVGIVLGVEMSRLARSCRDWHQLLEVCALFGTLIGDLDGVYDPRNYNDRLLLGLKGTMSEAELHVLKQRMLAGKQAKAGRGELGMRLPMGYVRRLSGEIAKDPDEQAQAVIQLVFDQFERSGTLNGVLQYLVRHQIQLPHRVHAGPAKGELEWRCPNRATLSNLLRHPIYAGAYVYGRRPSDPRRQQPGRPGTGRTVARPDECQVLLQDRLPAYISWEQFTRNLKQLEANNAKALGPVRPGASLLSGLLVCGRCGLRMTAQYTQNGKGLRYVCSRDAADYGGPLCQSLSGAVLDRAVGEWVLKALEPAALEVSLQVARDAEAERRQLHSHWTQRLERARYQAERAFRQYNAVEPENRLVVRTLEKQWEAALAEEENLKAEYAGLLARQPPVLSERECEDIRRLAEDIPALWRAATTTAEDRQSVARQLVERVVVAVQGESERVDVQIRWRGGTGTRFGLVRPVAKLEQLSYYPQLLARGLALHEAGNSLVAVAAQLNAEGWLPAKRRATFTAEMVGSLLARQGIRHPRPSPAAAVLRRADEWTLPELACELAMPAVTLYHWLKRGKLKARREASAGHTLWLIQADASELARLRSHRTEPRPRARQGTAS